MKPNVGGADRGVRLIVGAFLVAAPIVIEFPGYWGLVPFAVGAVLVVTGATRRCPLNSVLGVDTAHSH